MPGAKASVPGEPSAGARDDEAERQRFLDAIAEGIADADAGRVHTHAEVVDRMRARFAARSK
jgi:predicted transcriptional regulator